MSVSKAQSEGITMRGGGLYSLVGKQVSSFYCHIAFIGLPGVFKCCLVQTGRPQYYFLPNQQYL